MTKTKAVEPAICSGINAITPCGRDAEPGGQQCTEHRWIVDEFERAYDL
jgi:hypothetical protein